MSSSLCKFSSPFDLRLLSHSLTDLFTSCFLSLFLLLPDLGSLRQYTMRPPPPWQLDHSFWPSIPITGRGPLEVPCVPRQKTHNSGHRIPANSAVPVRSPRVWPHYSIFKQLHTTWPLKLPHTDRLTAVFPTVRSCGKGRCRLGCRAVLPSSNRVETINIILNLLLTALTVEEKQ